MNHEAFVYCWTDKKTNKLYIGVHKGKCDDRYISSSKIFLKEYKSRPEDFTRQIIAMGNYKDMYFFETKILKLENVIDNDNYYNIAMNNGYFKNRGLPLSEEHKSKISEKVRGKNHPFYGKKHSEESRLRMSLSRKKYMIENDDNMCGENHPMWNRSHTEEHKKNISKSLSGKKRSAEAIKNAGHGRSGCYLIIFPTGEQKEIKNLAKFCRENNLHISNMFNRGKSKGFICKKLNRKEL